MTAGHRTRPAPFWSILVGAVGAFIFFGILSGWFPVGENETQLATPPDTTLGTSTLP